jgi:hypothetical protein
MKSVIPVLLLVVAIAVAASLAWLFLNSSFPGREGDFKPEQRSLPPFKRIVIHGLAEVTLEQGPTESIAFESTPRRLAQVRADVSDGTLTLGNNATRSWFFDFFGGGSRPLRAKITFRDLESVAADGAVKVVAQGLKSERLRITGSGATSLKVSDLDVAELAVSGSGAMKAELAGRVTEQVISISGAGDYRAADLVSDTARVSVSGAGRVVVNAAKTLAIALSGAGTVEYLGDPKVTQKISGAGRIKRRDAAGAKWTIAAAAQARSMSHL